MTEHEQPPVDLKVEVAHPARMYDYYLGGKDNYEADRVAAEAALAAAPELRAIARENRAFLHRVVRHLVNAGVRQFLDLGAGLPTQRNVHEVAQEIAPETRVVYVDNDPIVLVHARALLSGRGRGRTAVVQADVRDTEAIIADERVRELIDFSEPLAVMLVSVLQFVPDREPQDIVAPLRDAMPSGGYLVVSHPTQDFRTSQVNEVAGAYNRAKAPAVARRKSEIERVFDGFELLEPGIVQTPLWRPDGEVTPDLDLIWMYGAVGRKP
ncbi:S-adenosyl methyltransferase [Actinomadura hallensis]|uniref:S-adenosyl methyltransferase n=1 Tax=Actinomadura hallensis TaxID=337895 RepID=A0A543IJY4_9ACTN|nr:SAM-dependent methyltransferase [Actinomadura hallensis]TQM70892.1 S-adenosyl methyltransferase [Actinomadura hallensis]HLV75244.1 SAM-dependent methyltransferase [Vulgatibacteraceae bacterium]